MIDIVSPEVRSRMMSGIQGKNTKPEILVRRFLHARGFRFRLHCKDLPARPDLVLKKYGCVILVHGCFWHRHPLCAYATIPGTRKDFWVEKFEKNVVRDHNNIAALRRAGWRVLVVWECGLKHSINLAAEIEKFVVGNIEFQYWPELPPKLKQTESPSKAVSG